MNTRGNTQGSSSKSADNRDEPELPPATTPASNVALEPQFIDETEENSAIITTGVFADKNMK
jgi:hypothetical protein